MPTRVRNTKRTLASLVYVPTGGVNFDTNGLNMGETECSDILNLRVRPDRIVQREGSRLLGSKNLATDDEALGTTDGSGNLSGTFNNKPIVAGSITVTVGASTYQEGDPGFTIDLTTGAFTLTGAPAATAATVDYTHNEEFLEQITYKDPDGEEILFGFTHRMIYKYADSTEIWSAAMASELSSSVSYWWLTEFTDETIGPTIVAAGSDPPAPTAAESDGSLRVLLYYNPTSGDFETLQLYEFPDYEITNEAGGAHTSGNNYSYTLANGGSGNVITKNTVQIESDGAPGTTYDDDGAGGFVVTSTGAPVPNSSIDYTTGAISILAFAAATGNITIDYDYKKPTTIKPRLVFNFHNKLVMANVYDGSDYYPWIVSWTQSGDITRVNISTDYVLRVDSDVSPFTGGSYMGDTLTLYRENSIETMWAGGTTFGFKTIWNDGTFAGKSVSNWNNIHCFWGKDDAYLLRGNQVTPIGVNRVRNRILDILNHDRIHYCISTLHPKYPEWWLGIVRSGESYPSVFFIYEIARNTWSYFDFKQEISSIGKYHTKSGLTIGELIGTIGDQCWTAEGGLLEGLLETMVVARGDGGAYILDERIASDWGESVDNNSTTTNEDTGQANGTSSYSAILANQNDIIPNTVTITVQNYSFTDDGSGNLTATSPAGTGTINYETGSFSLTFSGGNPSTIWTVYATYEYYDWVTTPVSLRMITKDFKYVDLQRKDRTNRMQFEAMGDAVTVGYSTKFLEAGPDNDTTNFSLKKVLTLDGSFKERKYWLDAVGEHIRYLFEGESDDSSFSLRWLQTFAITREKD